MSVHIESIDRQVISCKVQRFEDLLQRQILAISMNDDFLGRSAQLRLRRAVEAYIGVLLQLVLDESQEMFLVHACRVVDMSVDFSDIVEVTISSATSPTLEGIVASVPMRNGLVMSAIVHDVHSHE
jgi:hypothetical protein